MKIMGILNCTPDSFFSGSRKQSEEEIRERVLEIVSQGGDMIDVGACSTRPGGSLATEQEEMERLRFALPIIRDAAPEMPLSLDTFRPKVARMCVREYGDMMINAVSEGEDDDMFPTVADLGVPYVLMSTKATLRDMMLGFAEKVQKLRDLGQKDIILDPGFGFGKSLEQNFAILKDLAFLRELELPIIVGVSRKSMIYKTLGVTPEDSLNGTTVVNTMAVMIGAVDILRVHDVKSACEVVKLTEKCLK